MLMGVVGFLQGQWQNNLYNGQGTIHHCSGMIYEGLWINGRPAAMASKLVIVSPELESSAPLELISGTAFTLAVECQSEDGETVEGRNCSFHSEQKE